MMRLRNIIAFSFLITTIFTDELLMAQPESTLPSPTPHSCCRFDSDICGLTFTNFYWSAQQESLTSLYTSGNYIWSSADGGFVSSTQYNVTSSTTYSFTYYANSNYAKIFFREASTGVAQQVSSLSSTENLWYNVKVSCSGCCASFPCDGQLLLVTTSPQTLIIDNVGRDNACEEVLPCCSFNDVGQCGFASNSVNGFSWSYAATQPPIYPPTFSNTDYLYFEAVDYAGNEALDVFLESPLFNVSSGSFFLTSVYVKDSGSATTNNNLLVVFRDSSTGGVTLLDTVGDTSGSFVAFTFNCKSTHGNCCPSGICTGTYQFIAHLDAFGGQVMFAVDYFKLPHNCQ